MRLQKCVGFIALILLCASVNMYGAVITFNNAVSGATSFSFDGDGDGVPDVIFTTTDPLGFNTVGPGANQNYIHEPGLEGTSLLPTDLRVDFLNGASGSLSFGFALAGPGSASFQVFNSAGTVIGSATVPGANTATPSGTSSFPEGVVNVTFPGIASYATFNFVTSGSRYIIDDFTGTFGSTEPIGTPEPGTTGSLMVGAAALLMYRRYR